MSTQWIAAYYPSSILEDQRAKTLFCLLYDKVITHFPISTMTCGGGAGISDFFSDDPLVEAGILELREEYLLDDIGYDKSKDDDMRDNFDKFYELNVAGMALQAFLNEGAVPATDRPSAPLPLSILQALDLRRAAAIQASALAVQSLDFSLPHFLPLTPEDILAAREKLKDELLPFRAAMHALAPKIRAGLDGAPTVSEVFLEAQYQAQTHVIPQLEVLRRKLKLERGSFWRKVVLKSCDNLPTICLKWLTGAGAAAAVDAIRLAGGAARDALDQNRLVQDLLLNGGLGYLLKVNQVVTNDRRSLKS